MEYEELDKFIDELIKNNNVDNNIDFTEIDNIVEEIIKNNIKNNKKENLFDTYQIKTVQHKPTKINKCILQ